MASNATFLLLFLFISIIYCSRGNPLRSIKDTLGRIAQSINKNNEIETFDSSDTDFQTKNHQLDIHETSADANHVVNQRRDHDKLTGVIISELFKTSTAIAWFFMARYLLKSMYKALDVAIKNLRSLNASDSIPSHITSYLPVNCTLTSYELEIASTVLIPSLIDTNMKKIGGLQSIKKALCDSVFDPASLPNVQKSSLMQPVRGILLYGPPGCGKTTVAHALCKHIGNPIIHVTPSLILRKWVGESSQNLKALFSLAIKLQPCVIFIDEMDALFRARKDDDNSVDRNLKTEFMQLWDIFVKTNVRVIILGATNRPQDLDSAIQRRFERSFLIGMPDEDSRTDIFKALLQDTLTETNFDYGRAGRLTEGYTPSDLVNVCKAAAFIPVKEYKRAFQRYQLRMKLIYDNNLNTSMAVSPSTPNCTAINTTTTTTTTTISTTNSSTVTNSTTIAVDTSALNESKPMNATKGLPQRMPALPSLRPLRITDIEEVLQTVFPTAWSAKSYGSISTSSYPYHSGNNGHNVDNNNNNNTPPTPPTDGWTWMNDNDNDDNEDND